jgi:hypothetical protein
LLSLDGRLVATACYWGDSRLVMAAGAPVSRTGLVVINPEIKRVLLIVFATANHSVNPG